MLDIDFNQIVNMIENRRSKAYKKVNEEMVLLYLDIGKFLYDLKSNSGYGDKIVAKAAEFMKSNYPQLRGFTKRNLERMIQFYCTYKEDEIATPLVTQLSWTNNLLILSGAKTKEERYFYLKLAIKNNYSKRELDRQITSSYYERFILSEGKQLPTIKKTVDEDDYPNTRLLDTYSLEFLDLPNEYNEMDLKKSIIRNLKDFILEIGNDFTYIGDEYKVQIGNHDFFIDLLFYNRELSCLVAFELKLGEFKAEYLGKMNLYLEALDRNVKKDYENPSVGIILCSSTMISEYRLKLIDKKILEMKLKEMKSLLEEVDKQLEV